MMKQRMNKAVSLLMACLMLFSMASPVMAAKSESTISSVKEFVDFAQKCSLDTWSQGKTIRLTADLDLTGIDFSPIPTFGGTFLGGNHTISGLNLTGNGSRQGLFRCIQFGATVSDLNVKGNVQPGGSRANVGGIAGSNSGIIQNCNFQGTVKGDSTVGGVAGINHETGQINGCSVSGTVQGKTETGGIAGKNLGILMKCENTASVNTSADTAAPNNDIAEELAQQPNVNTIESILDGHTDAGGIAGYSNGVIQSCTNAGTVGYPHVGYNVGGVAGRQTGYLSGCINNGTVLGRKDVGGIAGQTEPNIAMYPGSDALQQLKQELDTLDSLISQALDDTDSANDDLSARLASMGHITDEARDSSKRLVNSTVGFIDGNMNSLNSISVTLVNALDHLAPAADELGNTAYWMELMIGKLKDGLTDLGLSPEKQADLKAAIQNLQAAHDDLQHISEILKMALDNLTSALIRNNDTGIKAAMKKICAALTELGASYRKAGDAFAEITVVINTVSAGDAVPSELQNTLYQIADSLEQSGRSLPKSLRRWEKIKNALEDVNDILSYGVIAAQNFGDAAAEFFTVLNRIADTESAVSNFEAAAEHAKSLSRSLEQSFEILADAIRDLSEDGPVEFATLGEETRTAGEDLYAALGNLSGEMQGLNTAMNGNGEILTADIRAISHQFNIVFDVLLDSLSDIQNGERKDAQDYIQDTSDEDIAATRLGKVADCCNTGTVEGDRNVGGILGSMAIEYDLDPENDIEHFSLNRTYKLKAVLEHCVNHGTVTGKKDCVGGLAGRMDFGTAIDGQNYGAVQSTGGNYVGGAVGYGDGSIRRCYTKCTLSGGNYVGGLAGWTNKLTDSCAIVTVLDGVEYVGAVAGDADLDHGIIRNNSFVDTGIAAIDGVSYSEMAVPITFENLRKQENVPSEFSSFTLTLVADGKTVAKIPFLYGNDLSLIKLPEVPEQEGKYGKWANFDASGAKSDITLEAIYTPLVTLVDSVEKDGKLSLALAEGSFTNEAELHVTNGESIPSMENRGTVWNVELSGTKLTDHDTVPLRLLNQYGKNAEVWQLVYDEWKEVDAVRSGKYLTLTMDGTTGTFCICKGTNRSAAMIWLTAISATLLLAAFICIIYFRRKKTAVKRRKTKSK